jgi:hypothetical protein
VKLTRKRTAPGPGTAGPTHVLYWAPGHLNSDGTGCWELQAAAAYVAGEPYNGTDPQLYDTPRDAPAAALAAWVAGQLGCPVELKQFSAGYRSVTLRPLSVHAGSEPAYDVYPLPAGTAR